MNFTVELEFVHFEVIKIVLWPVKIEVLFCPDFMWSFVHEVCNHSYVKKICSIENRL